MNILKRLLFFFALALVACSGESAAPTVPLASPTPESFLPIVRYKLNVQTDGMYRVTNVDLRNAGAPIEQINPATLRLYRGESEVAVRLLTSGADWSLEFYGQATDSPYSAFNVYWLTWGEQAGKRMIESDAAPVPSTPQDSFSTKVLLSRPTLYLTQFGDVGAPWFWQSLTAPATSTITVTLPSAVSASAVLNVNLWGGTQDTASPDHHVRLFFNDSRVADETWDGQGARVISATVPGNLVRAGANTLRMVAPGDTRAQADVMLLSTVEVTYSRRFVAQDDVLAFEVGAGSYRVEGFSSDAIELYDITDPGSPARVTNLTIAGRAVIFASTAPASRRWLAVGANARKPASKIVPMIDVRLRATERQADYIIISHPDFIGALQPLVQWRESHGLRVRLVTIDQVFDEFSYGAESPLAIRAFLDFAQRQWESPAPRFVLLVGKASYDYRNYLNAPNKNLVPTYLVETPHLRQAASDNWFVTSDEKTGRPTLALGRIPAKSADQVTRVVNKIIAYESAQSAEWRMRATFVADDKDLSFASLADLLTTKMKPGMQSQKIYLADQKGDVNTTRTELINRWNAGALLISYIGHGSIDTWAEGPLLSVGDLSELKNGERLQVLITPTCLDGFFYHPQKDSLAEELLFKSDGGIIAGLVPTGLSMTDAQSALMSAFFDQLFGSSPTLGEAITSAKQRVASESPDVREVIDTFVLLGDPAFVVGR